MIQDHVDKIIEQWQRERPDLDCSPMGIIGRMARMGQLLSGKVTGVYEQHGLDTIEFDILATLRRSGELITPTELYQTVMLSSGAMSVRLERLESRGLVFKQPNAHDKRSCKIGLTEEGLKEIDRALEHHVQNEKEILEPLTTAERQQLADLMRRWLLHNEPAE